jgi:hypothetical protein
LTVSVQRERECVQVELLFGGLGVDHDLALSTPHEPRDRGRFRTFENHAERQLARSLDGIICPLDQRFLRAECGMHAPGKDDAAKARVTERLDQQAIGLQRGGHQVHPEMGHSFAPQKTCNPSNLARGELQRMASRHRRLDDEQQSRPHAQRFGIRSQDANTKRSHAVLDRGEHEMLRGGDTTEL